MASGSNNPSSSAPLRTTDHLQSTSPSKASPINSQFDSITAPKLAEMLSRRIARASPLRAAAAVAARQLPTIQKRTFLPNYNDKLDEKYPDSDYPKLTEAEDPGQNGGYVQPPPIKRQFRDPHADWWDKQERRNYGEPCHEDFDLLGMFTPYEYTWVKPGKGLLQIGAFIATTFGVLYLVKLTYPDKPAYPREFEFGGLEIELGGPGARRARKSDDPEPYQKETVE